MAWDHSHVFPLRRNVWGFQFSVGHRKCMSRIQIFINSLQGKISQSTPLGFSFCTFASCYLVGCVSDSSLWLVITKFRAFLVSNNSIITNFGFILSHFANYNKPFNPVLFFVGCLVFPLLHLICFLDVTVQFLFAVCFSVKLVFMHL